MQIFPRSFNRLPLIAAVTLTVLGGAATFLIWYYWSPKNTQVGYSPTQPVPYSHRLHAGQMGMDCRYCHANVEISAVAMVPPTQTCIGCHAIVKTESAMLTKIHESWQTGQPMEWVRIHRTPDFVYFDHSVHVTAGVGCSDCHGRIDQMEVVHQAQPLNMAWCLDCHRNPEPHLRPKDQITNMEWQYDPHNKVTPVRDVTPPQHCSGCHR